MVESTCVCSKYIIITIVPLTPTGLQVVMEYYTVEDNTVTFAWDPPPGSGPEAIVDNYTISIMPIPVSHSITSVGLSSPWNVTLNYNVNYTATIIALNCAGMSDSLELISIEYGKELICNIEIFLL